jgi:hypothetical protein
VTIEVSSTDKRDGKALALFARCAEWQHGHTKDGRAFFAIPGSEPNLFHMTDQRDCSCPDRQRAQNLCKHIRAVRLWMAAFQTGAVTMKSRPTPTTPTAADDLAVLTPEGAAYLANLDEERDALQVSGAEHEVTATSFAPCSAGCGALIAPEDRRVSSECQACADHRVLDRYADLFEDDDKPYCTPCRRHHDIGAHYATIAS